MPLRVRPIAQRWSVNGRGSGLAWHQAWGSSLSDLRADEWGDVGLVTAWMEQDYMMDGEPQHLSAPTTFVLRRLGGSWRVALIHSVPLPDEG
jgi:ketosteroid isomerase-like protein